MRLLVTGSEGYLGQRLMNAFADAECLVGLDIQPKAQQPYEYCCCDIRDRKVAEIIQHYKISHVVHLASILQPSAEPQRDYDIDVNGTLNVLQACVANEVEHITVTSSGAAYGYHADNPQWLVESDPLRGHPQFSYSEHKREVEALLAEYRQQYPQLKQLVLRPGTVLGETTANPITALFKQRRLLAIRGSDSPFVFIWDEDLVKIVLLGVQNSQQGCFNLAGDGALTISEIAQLLNKSLLTLPAWLVKAVLWCGKLLRLTRYGPEQVDFLRYRPVLSNTALHQEFGYHPEKTSREVLVFYIANNQDFIQNSKRE